MAAGVKTGDLFGTGQRSLIGFDPSSWTLERMARGKKVVAALAMRSMTHNAPPQSQVRIKKSSVDRGRFLSTCSYSYSLLFDLYHFLAVSNQIDLIYDKGIINLSADVMNHLTFRLASKLIMYHGKICKC